MRNPDRVLGLTGMCFRADSGVALVKETSYEMTMLDWGPAFVQDSL